MVAVPNLLMITGAVISALCGISPDYAAALLEAQTQMTTAEPDRANMAPALPYANPELESEESLPVIKPWTRGKFLDRSTQGSELIQLPNGDKYWFKAGDFLPLYRVKGTQPVEIKNYRAGHDDQGKLRWEIKSLVPPMFLKPGELVAIDPTPLQLMGLFHFYTEDGRSGVLSIYDLMPLGEGGGI